MESSLSPRQTVFVESGSVERRSELEELNE